MKRDWEDRIANQKKEYKNMLKCDEETKYTVCVGADYN